MLTRKRLIKKVKKNTSHMIKEPFYMIIRKGSPGHKKIPHGRIWPVGQILVTPALKVPQNSIHYKNNC